MRSAPICSAEWAARKSSWKGFAPTSAEPIALHGRRAVRSSVPLSMYDSHQPPTASVPMFETIAHESNPCLGTLDAAQKGSEASHSEADIQLPPPALPLARRTLGPAARFCSDPCSIDVATDRPNRSGPTGACSGTPRPYTYV